MGKPRANFKTNNRKKKKFVQKEKFDFSKVKGRVVGNLQDGTPIVGSKSDLIRPWTHSPIFDKKNRTNKSHFDEILEINNIWGSETSHELIYGYPDII